MRRLAALGLAFTAFAVALVAAAEGDDGSTDDYLVRAYFDNAGFLVEDEEVRVAGATVGTIEAVDVSMPGEPVLANGEDDPGKAVVVLRVTDPGFQDFRTDASCLIRPQSLLGEKFVECKPTEPRSAVSEPPPELEVIPEGERGEGQRFLPLENNGKAVDLDLVNNIYREPEIEKFRLILNDLGAGLAARGEVLGEVIERANPALQETDRVLAILAEQNQGLAQLAADSDAVLEPLARERDAVAGFINNATVAGEAAAERREDIAAGFREFPNALAELESTMEELRRLAVTATPVAADLRVGAPSLTGATEALGPFAGAATGALTSLGDAAEESAPDLIASRSLINDLGSLGEANRGGARALDDLLTTLRQTGGRDDFYTTILGLSNALNGYDSYGHFLRTVIQINNCADVSIRPVTSCGSKWTGASAASASELSAAELANANPTPNQILSPEELEGVAADPAETAERPGGSRSETRKDASAAAAKSKSRAGEDLLSFLMGDDG